MLFGRTRKYTIYIGLDVQDGEVQFTTEEILLRVKEKLIQYSMPFSINVVDGGYLYKNKDFVCEKGVVITLLGASKKYVEKLAKIFCNDFKQECVLVTTEIVKIKEIIC